MFRVEVHPRSQLRLDAVDNSLSDINFFEVTDIDDKTVAIKVSKSLEDLVDRVSYLARLILSFISAEISCVRKSQRDVEWLSKAHSSSSEVSMSDVV